MQKIFIVAILTVVLSVANAYAKKYSKVDHCDTDEQTHIETCYGEDGKELNGWAITGNQPEDVGKNRRKAIKFIRAQRRNSELEIDPELQKSIQPYTLSKFSNGKKHGTSRVIDVFGYDVKRIDYSKGRKNGRYEVYYENHNLQAYANYKDGVLDGRAVFFDVRGRKIGEANYRRGILLKGYCRNKNGDKIELPTDGKTVVTEVAPCPST